MRSHRSYKGENMSTYVNQDYTDPGYIADGVYVDGGYVEDGYLADEPKPYGDRVKIRFFVSFDGNFDAEGIKNTLSADEVGLLYSPGSGKFMFIDAGGVSEFVSGALDMDAIKSALLSDSDFLDEMRKLILGSMQMQVTFLAPDGTVLATPEVERDGTAYLISVPDELAGAAYSVSIEVR